MLKIQTMNLDYVRTFITVAQSKDMRDAGRKLELDPSNVGRHIKSLENLYGTKLINVKNRRSIELTESGKQLFYGFEKAYNILCLTEKKYFQNKSLDSGKISIGIDSSLENEFLNDKLYSFKSKYPNVDIKIINYPTNDLYERLSQYYIDVVIDKRIDSVKKSSNITSKKIVTEEYVIAYNKDASPIKSINDLNNMRLVVPISTFSEREELNNLFKQNKIDINLSLEYANYNSISSYINKNMGYVFIPKRLISNDVNYYDIGIKKDIVVSYIDENLTLTVKEFLKEFDIKQ